MNRRVEEPAVLQPRHVVLRTTTHGTACWPLAVLLCLYFGCLGCHSFRSLSDSPDFTTNSTVAADNICVKDVVQEGQYNYYNLEIGDCFGYAGGYLSVEARVYPDVDDKQEWFLLISTDGEPPTYTDSEGLSNGTLGDFVDSEHLRSYTHLDVQLGASLESTPPWFAAVYSSSGPLQYTVKAWCSASKGCNLTCSDPDSGPCVSLGTCRCIRRPSDKTCDIEVESLSDDNDFVTQDGLLIVHNEQLLRHGEWQYFQYKVLQNNSRLLVELARAQGDVALFLKPQDGGSKVASLPSESDAIKFSDLESFQNRLSHHHIFTRGSGTYYIGVFNADHCVQEDTTFNLTITVATPSSSLVLCPLNCSYPQGTCIRDNHCECQPGYGGNFCGGSLWPAMPWKSFSGQLKPGQWAYINLLRSELSSSGNVSVKFSYEGGHPILLAQQSDYPTLTNYYVKFSDETLQATASSTYQIDKRSLAEGNLILAVFNVDYQAHGESAYEIVILGTLKGLSIWIILLAAVASSGVFILLISMGTCRFSLQRGGEQPEDNSLDFEDTLQGECEPAELIFIVLEGRKELLERRSLDRVVVSTFPLLAYQEGLFPTREEAQCSICLNNYNIAELLCRIPICKHVFHVKCIDEWFQTHSSCPLCRVSLEGRHLSAQNSAYLSGSLAGGLQLPLPSSNGSTPSPASGLDEQASSSNSQPVESTEVKPSPEPARDNQPLLVRIGSSRSDSDSGSPPLQAPKLWTTASISIGKSSKLMEHIEHQIS